jgi:hypothetical protein
LITVFIGLGIEHRFIGNMAGMGTNYNIDSTAPMTAGTVATHFGKQIHVTALPGVLAVNRQLKEVIC